MSGTREDDELLFVNEDDDIAAAPGGQQPWRVFIVDDDPDVHTTSTFALRGTQILGRPLSFLHANSAAQACAVLERDRDIAVILLDVVMEQDDSGLQLVRTIRETFGMRDVRIILRTGQPGYAPELEAIRDYDINDYKTKSELTRNKLYTTLTSAIRSYDQIRTIDLGRRGLDTIVRATRELLSIPDLRDFAAAVIAQLAALAEVAPSGLIGAAPPDAPSGGHGMRIIAAAGRHVPLRDMELDAIGETTIREALQRCLAEERHQFGAGGAALFLRGREGRHLTAWLDVPELGADMRRLLELFCSNVAIGLDNVQLLSQLHSYAFFDALSQLPNRRSLIQRIDECLASSRRSAHTLMLIDLDQFAEINDALGHHFGDMLLQGVAQRLQESLGGHCALARIASDTFGILGPAERLLPGDIQALFRDPFVIDGQELLVSATLGIAHLADIDGNGGEALKDANIALRRAKLGHRGEHSFFTRDMAIEIRERLSLLQALRHAMERDCLFLAYQPQIDLRTGHACGIEALLRWRSDDGRIIPPDRFIPLAERSGMIVNIGEWVARMACQQQVQLRERGFGHLRVSINVSVIQLRHPRFMQALGAALADSGADPARIELEITESIAMEEADFLARTLEAIKGLGLGVAIDDFGTGFSSLSYLQRLPVDRLKIDRAFVTDIIDDERARRIPELVIQLGQKLDLAVIAEGVETSEQTELLRQMGCHEAQGYHFGRPMEVAQLIDWLIAHRP